MATLVLLRSRTHEGIFNLAIRRHDLSGVDYERIASLSIEQAVEVNAINPSISFLHGHPYQTAIKTSSNDAKKSK